MVPEVRAIPWPEGCPFARAEWSRGPRVGASSSEDVPEWEIPLTLTGLVVLVTDEDSSNTRGSGL